MANMKNVDPWPNCWCGLPMYLVGKGEGAYACRVHDEGMRDLPIDETPEARRARLLNLGREA